MDDRRDFDCLDFKLMLTAIVDGTAPTEGRQTAERHALSCPACLKLLEEAEATDFMLKLAARAEPVALPEGFVDRVVERARAEGGDHRSRGSSGALVWRERGAWLAAAAALVLAIMGWTMDRGGSWTGVGGRSRLGAPGGTIASPVFSGVRDLSESDLRRAGERAAEAESIASLLGSLADAMEELAALDASDAEEVAVLSRRLSADALLARASLLRIALPVDQRADVQAVESALLALTAGCLDAARLEELQASIRTIGLAQRLRDTAHSLPRILPSA